MDQKNSIFAQLAAIPILAVFIGVAILAVRIGMDWTPQTTQTVVGGFLTICAGSVALIGVIIGLLVGLALHKRISREQPQPAPPAIRTISGYPIMPYREPGVPQLSDGRERLGSWSSNGPASYDVWEEPEPAEWSQARAWQEGGRQ